MTRMLAFVMIMIITPWVWASSAKSQLINYLDKFHSLKTHFKQKVVNAKGEVVGKAQGTMYIKRPNHFRWEVKKPYAQLMIANGRTLRIYDKDLNQVTIRNMKQNNKINPATLLSGKAREYIKQFHISKLSTANSVQGFKLKPKKQSDMLKTIALFFKANRLVKMHITDQFGQKNRYYFSNTKLNIKLSQKHFKMNLPRDVDVIDNRNDR